MDLAGTYLVNTSNLDQAAVVLSREYGPMRLRQNATETAWIRIWRTGVGPMTVDDTEITSRIRVHISSAAGLVLCRVRSGSVTLGNGEQLKSFSRGDLVAVFGNGEPLSGLMDRTRCDLVTFDRSLFVDMVPAGACGAQEKAARRFAQPISPSAGQLVGDVMDHIRTFVANNPVVSGNPHVATSAARYLVATMMAAFPDEPLTAWSR